MKWYSEVSNSVKTPRERIRAKNIPTKAPGEFYATWIWESEDGKKFFAPYIIWDIDTHGDETLEVGFKRARFLVGLLRNDWDVPDDAIRVVFSTGKGFHVYLDSAVVGLKSSKHLHSQIRTMCEKILRGGRVIDPRTKSIVAVADAAEAKLRIREYELKGLKTWTYFPYVDTSLYSLRRIVGIPNSRHRSTGLFYTYLSCNEFLTLQLYEIQALAKGRRKVPPRGTFDVIPAFAEFFKKCGEEAAPKIESGDMILPAKTKLQELISQDRVLFGTGAPKGQRNEGTFRLCNSYRRLGLTIRETAVLLLDMNTRNNPPMSISALRKIVNSSYVSTGEQL